MYLVHQDAASKFTLFFNLYFLNREINILYQIKHGAISHSSSMILLFRFGQDEANGPLAKGPAAGFLLRSAFTSISIHNLHSGLTS